MKSKLYLNERVDNKDFTFGELKNYFPVIILDKDGKRQHGLLTKNDIKTIIARADKNKEDMPNSTFWTSMKEDDDFNIENV